MKLEQTMKLEQKDIEAIATSINRRLEPEDIEDIATLVAKKIEQKNKVYSVPEIATILSCHNNTVYNYIEAKLLKATKKGKGHLITQDSLNNFLNEKM